MEKDMAMNKQRAFTIIELLVVISILAVLAGLLFPAIGAVKRHAKQTENSSKVRGIIQAMVQSSESRRGFFPGFDGFSFTADGLATTGNSGVGQTTQARFWIILNGNYTDGAALISPQESKDPWTLGSVTTDNYSYAMSTLNDNNGATLSVFDRYRREEWRNEQNALAPVVTDRLASTSSNNPVPGNPTTYLSIHDGADVGEWQGSVGFGDIHVEFLNSSATAARTAGEHSDEDDIFDNADGTGGTANKNAMMTYQGFDNPIGLHQ
jgi:prepilin-type N-terminal cleavage/methylation domain-containing protein